MVQPRLQAASSQRSPVRGTFCPAICTSLTNSSVPSIANSSPEPGGKVACTARSPPAAVISYVHRATERSANDRAAAIIEASLARMRPGAKGGALPVAETLHQRVHRVGGNRAAREHPQRTHRDLHVAE